MGSEGTFLLAAAVESDTPVNLSQLISMSKGPSSFRWQMIRVWRQKEMKGTPLTPLPTRGFLQRRRKSQMLCLCCWDHGASVQLLKHAARGAALGSKLEIKILYNPSFPFKKTFFFF